MTNEHAQPHHSPRYKSRGSSASSGSVFKRRSGQADSVVVSTVNLLGQQPGNIGAYFLGVLSPSEFLSNALSTGESWSAGNAAGQAGTALT
jgi:hypothetical protein